MLSFKITTVGSSSGLILTKEAMTRLRVKKGDTLYLTEARMAAIDSRRTTPNLRGRWHSLKTSCTTTAKYCGPWRNE